MFCKLGLVEDNRPVHVVTWLNCPWILFLGQFISRLILINPSKNSLTLVRLASLSKLVITPVLSFILRSTSSDVEYIPSFKSSEPSIGLTIPSSLCSVLTILKRGCPVLFPVL